MGAGRPTKRRRYASPTPDPPLSEYLFKLPLELRLQIYDYALSDVTITVAEQAHNIFDSIEAAAEPDSAAQGLPSGYVPLVKNDYDRDLVMVGKKTVLPYVNLLEQPRPLLRFNPAAIERSNTDSSLAGLSMDSGYASAGSSMYSIASTTSTTSLALPSRLEEEYKLAKSQPVTNISLLQVNKQIRHEVLAHLQSRSATQRTLYITYPYGLLVLERHYPALLRSTKHIVITGSYTPPASAPSPSSSPSSPQPPPNNHQLAARKCLQRLVRTLYASYRNVPPAQYYKDMHSLQMRIFYPDERHYSTIWGDDESPVMAAMQHIPAGNIETKVWRGRAGNGVTLRVAPPSLPSRPTRAQDQDAPTPADGDAHDEKSDSHDEKGEFPTHWLRNFSSVFRRFKLPRGMDQQHRRTCCRRALRRRGTSGGVIAVGEEFWEACFADETLFGKEVPEERFWGRV